MFFNHMFMLLLFQRMGKILCRHWRENELFFIIFFFSVCGDFLMCVTQSTSIGTFHDCLGSFFQAFNDPLLLSSGNRKNKPSLVEYLDLLNGNWRKLYSYFFNNTFSTLSFVCFKSIF